MDNIIRTILTEWKSKKIPLIIPREISLQEYLSMKVNKIIVLNGFRRVGKTYISYGLANNLLSSCTDISCWLPSLVPDVVEDLICDRGSRACASSAFAV